ncbi:MAG: hypothetical protein QG585_511 [Patescibacteria group bacterium]|jgi:hypothetical protein|nr:hypothetical protein [Patescibacteria group bacterium]
MSLENFEKDVDGAENLRKVAQDLETSGATTHPDEGAAEFAQFMKKGLEQHAEETEKNLDAQINEQADKGERLL